MRYLIYKKIAKVLFFYRLGEPKFKIILLEENG